MEIKGSWWSSPESEVSCLSSMESEVSWWSSMESEVTIVTMFEMIRLYSDSGIYLLPVIMF